MIRDVTDSRIVNVLSALAAWQLDDGETFEPTSVEMLVETMNLEHQRAEVVRAMLETYLRVCDEHALGRLEKWATDERRIKQDIDNDRAAEAALVAIGVEKAEAERIVYQARRKAEQQAQVVQ